MRLLRPPVMRRRSGGQSWIKSPRHLSSRRENRPRKQQTVKKKKPSDKPQDTAVNREGAADLKAKVELQDDQERPKVTLIAKKRAQRMRPLQLAKAAAAAAR